MIAGLFRFSKVQIFIVLFIILAIVVLAILSLEEQPIPGTTPTSSPSASGSVKQNPVFYSSPVKITSYTPTENTPLVPGQPSEFTYRFNSPVQEQGLSIRITENDSFGEVNNVEFTQNLDSSNTILQIKTINSVSPSSTIKVQIDHRGAKIFAIEYISARTQPAPAPSNNPALIQFLPHQTDSYNLTYLPDTNFYNFSFIYDDSSAESTQEQFEKAKSDAIEFIRSKGIDPDELKINWSYK